ncbi:MAG: HEAT repeat domain-containing protein [Armatimonadetes bacterium]|nr:HEAT repeat domain-containing protein [Armatimonadota bacterium]
MSTVVKGWRIFFYSVIGLAVLSIGWITAKFILTERLVKATGNPSLEVRERAAVRVMNRGKDRDKPIKFLSGQPQTVRDNVVWALCAMVGSGDPRAARAVEWVVEIARDMSGDLPPGDADWDASRLAVQRLGDKAFDALVTTLSGTTKKTLERDKYAHRRAVAARLLGLLGDARATKPLVVALRDPYAMVRQQAAAALARLNTPEAQPYIEDYLQPLLAVLDGRYLCYVRLDSEGRIRHVPDRTKLLYGPFVVTVKPHQLATEADLKRQQDSAVLIEKKEQERLALTRRRLEEGRRGQVLKRIKGDTALEITDVHISRTEAGDRLKVVDDPQGKDFDLIEGEPMQVDVEVTNNGPGDLVSDFFVAVYAGSPLPRNHVDMPESGEYKGERARDNRALAGVFEQRHVQTLFAHDRPQTSDRDEHKDTVSLSLRFNTVEDDRIEALQQLMYVGHEKCVAALGKALDDASYTVRRQAAEALARILQARRTTPAARQEVVVLLRGTGLTSPDAVVRCTAAEALQTSGDAASVPALHALLLNDADPTVRLVAQRALAGLPQASREKLLPALVSEDPGVRLVAPRLFQSAGDEEVARRLLFSPDEPVAREVLRSGHRLLRTEHLIAALELPDPLARSMAARRLADRADPLARVALLKALHDSDGKVRESAARGLGKLLKANPGTPAPEVVKALIAVIDGEAGDYVGLPADKQPEDPSTAVTTNKKSRAAAAEALVGLQAPEAGKALRGALDDTNPDVLAAVIPAVATGQIKGKTDRLIKIIEVDKDPKLTQPARVRRAAILALWKSGDNSEKALDSLVGLLNDPSDVIKTAAAVALIGLGDTRGNKVLRDQVTNKNLDIRREAATLLATLTPDQVAKVDGLKKKDRNGLDILLEDLYARGSRPVNFNFLCRSLVFLGRNADTKPQLLAMLQKMLTDVQPVPRAAAVAVLAELGEPNARDAVLKLLDDPMETPRSAAAEAVGDLGLFDQRAKLVTLAHEDPSSGVRDKARMALAKLDTTAS